jgi:hypothetical protein
MNVWELRVRNRLFSFPRAAHSPSWLYLAAKWRSWTSMHVTTVHGELVGSGRYMVNWNDQEIPVSQVILCSNSHIWYRPVGLPTTSTEIRHLQLKRRVIGNHIWEAVEKVGCLCEWEYANHFTTWLSLTSQLDKTTDCIATVCHSLWRPSLTS